MYRRLSVRVSAKNTECVIPMDRRCLIKTQKKKQTNAKGQKYNNNYCVNLDFFIFLHGVPAVVASDIYVYMIYMRERE